MFVDQRILEDLCRDAGATRKDKAIKYQKQGKVEIRKLDYKNNKNFEIVAKVHGTDTYNTYINIENGVVEDVTCTCPDYYNYYGICKHTLATVLEIANNPQHVGQTVDNDSEIKKSAFIYFLFYPVLFLSLAFIGFAIYTLIKYL